MLSTKSENTYVFLGQTLGVSTWLTPSGEQEWKLCKVRKPFVCAKTGKWHPAGTFAWRPCGNPKNRNSRIFVDHSLDSRTVATIVAKNRDQGELVRQLVRANKPMALHVLSHYMGLDYKRCMRAFEKLEKEGLLQVVDEWGETSDWYQGNGTAYHSYVIYFRDR